LDYLDEKEDVELCSINPLHVVLKNPSFLKSATHYCARGYILKAIKV